MKQTLGRGPLATIRKRAKLAAVVEWAVTEIAAFKPKKPGDLSEFATDLQKKMSDKGVGKKERGR